MADTSSEFPIAWSEGKYGGDETRVLPNFVLRMENAILHPDDGERPWKIPGRSLAGTLPAGVTAPKGIAYCRFPENDQDQIILLGNNILYRATVAESWSVWATLVDQATPAAAFPVFGSFVKAIPTGDHRYILFTAGGNNERPLIIDQDGNVRLVSLQRPNPPALEAITGVAGSILRPGTTANPATVYAGASDGGFLTPEKVWDGLDSTYASATFTAVAGAFPEAYSSIKATDWYGTGWTGVLAVAGKINIVCEAAKQVVSGGGALTARVYGKDAEIQLFFQISTTATPAYNNFIGGITSYQGQTTLQYPLPIGTDMANVRVRAVALYKGTALATAIVREISFQPETLGAVGAVTDGTYTYAITEVYTQLLSDGTSFTVESSPSEIKDAHITLASKTGVTITLPTSNNTTAMGVIDSRPNRYRAFYIYRTTSTGAYPDMGKIGEALLTDTTFIDRFDTAGTTLAATALNTVYVGDGPYPTTEPAPAFIDATLHKGSIVAIPYGSDTTIVWSIPSYPEYFPTPQSFSFFPVGRGESGKGLASLGDSLLVFSRTRVHRVRELPMATSNNFDLTRFNTDVLSHNEGLAGSPLSYVLFQGTGGQALCAWVSYTGIWMTDGFLPAERGMGCVRLTENKSWRNDVDTNRLPESRLTFDPVLQAVIFDYYNRDGVFETEYLHVANCHWTKSASEAAVPKISGPHTLTAISRIIGEHSDKLQAWDLTTAGVLLARNGTQNNGSDILTHIETGWFYPAGPRGMVHLYVGSVGHSDWGAGEACSVEIQVRNDQSGIIETITKTGITLRGNQNSDLGWINTSGRAFKVILRHLGKTTSTGAPIRAFGPMALQVESIDEGRLE